MPSSLSKSSFVILIILFAISCIVPFATALPGGVRPRETKLPEFPSFIPICAVECTEKKIAAIGCQDQACLCGSPDFQKSLWSCIDGDCGGPTSQEHIETESMVRDLCKSRNTTASMTESSTSSTSSQMTSATGSSESMTETSTASRSSQEASLTAQISTTPTAAADDPLTATTEDATVSDGATVSASAAAAKKEKPMLSTPAIIGISIGAFCLTAAVIGACVFCACRRNHRKQAQSLEPHSPRGGAAISGDKGNIGYGGWISIDHSNSAGGYYSNHGVTPIDTDVANEKPNAHNVPNISPVSPVSPTIPRGFEFGESIQQGQPVGSRKIMENLHQNIPPAMVYTPPSPIGSVDRTSDSVILPSPAQNRVHSSNFSVHGYPGIAISTDSPEDIQMPSSHHNTRPQTTEKLSDHSSYPLISTTASPEYVPSHPVSESSASTRSSIHSTQGPPNTGISRSDTLAWRRELDEAAGRALTRVLHSEQSINEEMDEAKRRKSSIPGLNRFSRRLSRDHRADEENSLVGGEKSTSFWGGFGSKGSRTSRTSPAKGSGFMNRRLNSNASGGSKRSIIPERVRGGGIN